jgi:hypothetical protein
VVYTDTPETQEQQLHAQLLAGNLPDFGPDQRHVKADMGHVLFSRYGKVLDKAHPSYGNECDVDSPPFVLMCY